VAAGGAQGAAFAAAKADGLFATDPDPKITDAWRGGGGKGPAYAEVAISWARDRQSASRMTASASDCSPGRPWQICRSRRASKQDAMDPPR
jgi:hypothetical protein